MRFFSGLFACGTILLAACTGTTEQALEQTTVRWGTSFGMCAGYCRTELQVDSATMRLTRTSWDTAQHPERIEQQALEKEGRQKVAATLDRAAFERLQDVYGCPDCADGGAEWVEVQTGASKKRVTFEFNKSPAEIQDLVIQLRALRGRFPAD